MLRRIVICAVLAWHAVVVCGGQGLHVLVGHYHVGCPGDDCSAAPSDDCRAGGWNSRHAHFAWGHEPRPSGHARRPRHTG